MAGKMVEFPSNGDTTAGYLATPKNGKGPGVLVIQEWWGLVGHIKNVCDRFAAEGFSALAPDLYHGQTADEPDAAGKLFMALNIAQAEKDLRGAAKYLAGQSSTAKLGAVGFCMGGQLALFAGIDNVRFKRQVRPGDTLRIEVELAPIRRGIGMGSGTATVDGELACRGEIMFALVDKPVTLGHG